MTFDILLLLGFFKAFFFPIYFVSAPPHPPHYHSHPCTIVPIQLKSLITPFAAMPQEGDPADRSGWSGWEQNSEHTPSRHRSSTVSNSSNGVGTKPSTSSSGSSRSKNMSKRKGSKRNAPPDISRDFSGRGRGTGKGRGGGRGNEEGGGGDLRQMDIASSFKGAAQKSLSDSARQEA